MKHTLSANQPNTRLPRIQAVIHQLMHYTYRRCGLSHHIECCVVFVLVELLYSTYDIVLFPCLLREEFNLLNAAFQIIRGGVIPLDIATVQTGDGGKCYMSLGLVADVVIEFRKMGETRFVLGECVCLCVWPYYLAYTG